MEVILTGIVEDGSEPGAAWLPLTPRFALEVPYGSTLAIVVKVFSRSGVPVLTSGSNTALSFTMSQNPGYAPFVTVSGVPSPAYGPNAWSITLNQTQWLGAPPSGQFVYSVWLVQPGPAYNPVIPASGFNVLPASLVPTLTPVTLTPSSASIVATDAQQFTAAGGTGVYTWSVSPNNSGGSVSSTGLYTAGSTSSVSDAVKATDSQGRVGSAAVGVLAPVTVSPSSATVSALGTQQFAASGGSGSYSSWEITNLPAYGSIDDSGLYTAGSSSGADTVQVTDSLGNPGTATVTVNADPLTISPLNPAVQVSGPNIDFSASGGTGTGYTYAIIVNQSGGSIVSSTGVYTPGNSVGYDTVRVTDSGSSHDDSIVNVFAV